MKSFRVITNSFLVLFMTLILDSFGECCSVDNAAMTCMKTQGKFLNLAVKDKIMFIYIIACDMHQLEKEDFLNFPRVTMISIYNSTLKFPESRNFFSGLYHLEDLRIENSNLTEDMKFNFANNNTISSLILAENKIRIVRRNFVGRLLHINEIDLSYNEIYHIEEGAFSDFPSLKTLNLSGNRLGTNFDSAFLTQTFTTCFVCRPNYAENICADNDVIECTRNIGVDQLWWLSFNTHISLSENPICRLITGKSTIEKNTVLDILPTNNSISTTLQCEIDNSGKCYRHESRKYFFLQACGIQTPMISRPVEGTTQDTPRINSPETNTENDGNIVFSANISLITFSVTSLVVLGAILGGLITWLVIRKFKMSNTTNSTPRNSRTPSEEQRLIEIYPEHPNSDNHQTNKLYEAVYKGDTQQVQTLVSIENNLYYRDEYGNNLLHIAAKRGYIEIVRILLNCINNFKDLVNTSSSQMHLPRVFDVRETNKKGETPIHCACKGGHSDVVELLLKASADPNVPCSDGHTPVHIAVRVGLFQTLTLLLDHGGRVDTLNKYGDTPIHVAAWNGRKNMLDKMLTNTEIINKSNLNGNTPIINSARRGHDDTTKLLLDRGANPNLRNNKNNTALMYAARDCHSDVVKILLDRRADIHVQNNEGNTALHAAVKGGRKEVIITLINRGANPNTENFQGVTPMQMAKKTGRGIDTLFLQNTTHN